MASSSKVLFNLEILTQKAVESLDERIRLKQEELDKFGSEDAIDNEVKEWRAHQEEKISDVFRKLGDGVMDDLQLSRFRLEEIPQVDRYEINRVRRDLSSLEALRSKIAAKTGSLVADEDGSISLTKTQLTEFFGL